MPNNLKEYRVKAGLTQKEVSQLLGFTNEVSLCHWEQGKNIPNLLNLFKLSCIYNTEPKCLHAVKWNEIARTLENLKKQTVKRVSNSKKTRTK